ncbi:MAG TPA: hypothetical protein VHC95_01730 [Opitutales bacterium]|nr:hypothetical protein [Opitutales bacterium]
MEEIDAAFAGGDEICVVETSAADSPVSITETGPCGVAGTRSGVVDAGVSATAKPTGKSASTQARLQMKTRPRISKINQSSYQERQVFA